MTECVSIACICKGEDEVRQGNSIVLRGVYKLVRQKRVLWTRGDNFKLSCRGRILTRARQSRMSRRVEAVKTKKMSYRGIAVRQLK